MDSKIVKVRAIKLTRGWKYIAVYDNGDTSIVRERATRAYVWAFEYAEHSGVADWKRFTLSAYASGNNRNPKGLRYVATHKIEYQPVTAEDAVQEKEPRDYESRANGYEP